MGYVKKRLTNWFPALIGTLILVAGLLQPFGVSSAKAADLSQFEAGYIISDAKFYDGNALSASGVQDFLNSKVPTCTINNGQPSHAAGAAWGSTTIANTCLKSFSQPTPTMAAQPGICSQYQGSTNESAASIIAKVGAACNISQKVLLVLLEKEQSLITDSWPTVRQINQATGFACYDNGQPCVQDYAGFFYQVWSAARQFQRYGTSPFTWYPVGQTSNILYQANNAGCGTKAVYIQNRATAALYYYTPYTPNSAALSAGYGIGDSCSAYGNRNFYQLYVDWFGSTKGLDVTGFKTYYDSLGGASSFLGAPTTNQGCTLVNSGCYQGFQNGAYILYSPATGAHAVTATVRTLWGLNGYERGFLGYPNGDRSALGDTYTQSFEGGSIVVTNGVATLDSWAQARKVSTWLGAVSTAKTCGLKDGGCYQGFQNGAFMLWSPASGAHAVTAAVRTVWGQNGFENGFLGYPTGDRSALGENYTQTFQGGSVTVTNGVATATNMSDPWTQAIAASSSWLGSATTDKRCIIKNDGCYQGFQNGAFMLWSPASGAHAVTAAVRTVWGQNGYENGFLGYPTGDRSALGDNYTQTFQGGTITVTNGVGAITSATDPFYNTVISNSNWLGSATTAKRCIIKDGGCYQGFQNGSYVLWSPSTGAHAVTAATRAIWAQYRYENGFLGYPTGDRSALGNNYTQTFQGGIITVTNGVGAYTPDPAQFDAAISANTSWLGSAITPKRCTIKDGGCYQGFPDGAYMLWSPTTGAHAVTAAVRSVWARYSYENGYLGYPTGDRSALGDNYTQTFQGGTIVVTNGVGRVQ